ncbi:pitrilysin family protein [Thalassotalea ponticola]|uniref:M16 family metallopeptidase n=1 Tax=Thalassotalea ponticola TaxID=1523392 RepID=UPI0025B41639|nr:pitrilysin family protein [Thalassotalea ponticola]MDN3653979.1 pitrilysin family protein [Thalassotalea ponticola]
MVKNIKLTMVSVSVALALGLSGCTVNADSQNQAVTQSTASAQAHKLTYLRTVEGIEEYQLTNGLKVLLFADASQPKTLVNITYRVGSVDEHYGETGMAHLLEHMLFKGSTNYPQIDTEFKKRGMQTNATTWLDRTNYFEVFDANEDTLAWALGMEADRMVNATFDEQQLQSEMTVVRNEMERNENNAIRMLLSRMSSTAFLWHNYGNSTIGARSDVENFPFARLRAFYKKHYRPDNAVLTIAGRFDKQATIERIEQTFGAIAKPEKPMQAQYTVEPTQDGEREVNLRRVGDVPYIGLAYHIPSGLHPDAAALRVLQEIMGDYTRGRLQKNLVETKIATAAFNLSFMLKDSSQYFLFAQGEKGKPTDVMEQKLIELIENIAQKPITEEEVTLAKLKLAKQAEQAMRDVTAVGMELSEYIAKGDYRHAFYFRDQIENVTADQVQAAAEKYFVASNRTLGRFIPTQKPVRAEIPQAPDLTEVLQDYKGKAVVAAGEVYDNSVANIKQRLRTSQWPEGTELNIYPKKLRGEEVIITMNFPSGSARSLTNQGQAIGFIGSLIPLANANYSKEQIATRLDQLKSSIAISTDAGQTSIAITTDKSHFSDTVLFLGELLSAPTFAQQELDVLRRSAIAAIETQRNEPRSIASNSFRKALYNYPEGHPYAHLSLDQQIEMINKVTPEQLVALYNSHFNINNGHITVVGDVDVQQSSDLLRQVLSPYSNNTPYQRIKRDLKPLAGAVVKTNTPDKANAQLYIVNPIEMKVDDPDYIALYIANSIFGGDAFTSRIGARIRVKEGYSYSVGSGIQADMFNDTGLFFTVAIAAPENMPAVVDAFKEEVAKVVNDGFSDEELERAVKGFISNRTRSWANDATVAGVINNASKEEVDLAFYDQQIEAAKSLTTDDVKAAFVKHIASLDFNVFMAGDFAKQEAIEESVGAQ